MKEHKKSSVKWENGRMSTKSTIKLEMICEKNTQDRSYNPWHRILNEEGKTGFKTFECQNRLVIPNLQVQFGINSFVSVWNLPSHPIQTTQNNGLHLLLSGINDATWFWSITPITWRNKLLPCSGHLSYSFPNVYIKPSETAGMFTIRFNITSSAFSNTIYLHVLYDSYNWHFVPIHYLINLSKGHTLCSLRDMFSFSKNQATWSTMNNCLILPTEPSVICNVSSEWWSGTWCGHVS